ncbi:hypothetical protein GCM10009101_27040 [Brevundimonas lenta]
MLIVGDQLSAMRAEGPLMRSQGVPMAIPPSELRPVDWLNWARTPWLFKFAFLQQPKLKPQIDCLSHIGGMNSRA